jgi:hypothetical protein
MLIEHRFVAMIFGRPMRVPPNHSLDISGTNIHANGVQPHKLRFFEDSCSLYEILGDILATFYTRLPEREEHSTTQTEQLTHLTRLDDRLTAWHAAVPDYLRSTVRDKSEIASHADAVVFARQANILHSR